MNVHHLELFYYVARHGGIMPAVRNIPYGIQQPAVSSQMAQLEEYLGVTLFHRRPFQLTAEGQKLHRFIEPFFSNLERITGEFQGGQARHIRIGASTIVLREHVPELFRSVQAKFKGLKMSLREGFPGPLEALLQQGEIDLAITVLEKKPPAGLHALSLMELPPVLLVGKGSPVRSAEELWKRDKIEETLITLPQGEAICKSFLKKLGEQGVDWFPGIETSSIDLIEAYVAGDLGIGLSVSVPKKSLPPGVREIPLKGFPPVVIGALWQGKKTPLIELFLSEAQKRAKRFL
jgi:DNA-binding transcriptional LysR family regulator